jgi:hypothetical protein
MSPDAGTVTMMKRKAGKGRKKQRNGKKTRNKENTQERQKEYK